MSKFKKMKLVPIDYVCESNNNSSNRLDNDISKIYNTSHNEDIKARLYTNALKKYLFKTFKYKNLNKVIDKNKNLLLDIPKASSNVDKTDLFEFEPTITSTPTIETSSTQNEQESTLKNQTIIRKPREKKLQAKRNIKKYFNNLSSDLSDPKDLTWINY